MARSQRAATVGVRLVQPGNEQMPFDVRAANRLLETPGCITEDGGADTDRGAIDTDDGAIDTADGVVDTDSGAEGTDGDDGAEHPGGASPSGQKYQYGRLPCGTCSAKH